MAILYKAFKIGDLKTDEKIVVMGKPDDSGVINAELIRVFANPANSNSDNPMNNFPTNNPPANPSDSVSPTNTSN